MRDSGSLAAPERTTEAQELFDEDISDLGYVMNVSRLWGYQPVTMPGLFGLVAGTTVLFPAVRTCRRNRN
jgi:hypothetical protein